MTGEDQRASEKSTPDRPTPPGGARPPAADAWSTAARADIQRPSSPPPKPRETGAAIPGRDKKDILRDRAKVLAREPDAIDASGSIEVVEFVLAHETYAIESINVREVYPLKELTPLPCTPDFVLGIVNVRGQVVTVIDLRKFFDLPVKGLTDLNKVIILQSDDMQIGIVADVISGIRSIPLRHFQPTLPTLTGVRADYLRGVTDQRVAVLNTDRILSDERILVHEEVET
jgi:purine-binding chemotaxis protein CheW